MTLGPGVVTAHTNPVDNKGSTYPQIGTTHTYRLWPNSGTALYKVLSGNPLTSQSVTTTGPALFVA